jgi:hypothetical protein
VPRIRPHSVRGAVGTKLNQLGIPHADASALLGHTVGVYVSTYVRRTEAGARSAAAALGALSAAVQ